MKHHCTFCGVLELVDSPTLIYGWIDWQIINKTSCPKCFGKARDEEFKALKYKIEFKTNKLPPENELECTAQDLIDSVLNTVKDYNRKRHTNKEFLSRISDIGMKHIKGSMKGEYYDKA